MLALSSCEFSEYYYEDVLWKMEKEVTSLSMEVDRGVNFNHLGEILKEFKNLTYLKFKILNFK